ncbi:uncharacterized protein [Palaemon carinicauda]|uniref:uncharacterized protein n=1 Tax=Palaemon carinicauda TaxID=392227 RepID=UPI0035B63104
MFLSACLAIFLPIAAFSWNPYFSGINDGFTPPKFTQPAPPACDKFQHPVQKFPDIWRNDKGKRNEQNVLEDPSTTQAPSQAPAAAMDVAGEAPWVNPVYQQQRLVGVNADYLLREEINVPSGTRITWYKNNVTIHQNVNNNLARSSLNSSRLVVSTKVYIDCAKITDGGLYTLQLDIPNRSYNWHRNYAVIIVGRSGIPGVSCRFSANEMAYIPRIYQYAKRAYVSVGESIVLPCGFKGLLADVAWYVNNTRISSDQQHETMPGGDLMIRQTSASETTHYTCLVWSTAYANLHDRVNTAVYVQE